MLVLRWLFRRAGAWMSIMLLAVALLVLAVEWVEAGAAGGANHGGLEALALALLALPDRLVRIAPLVAALGAAVAVVGLLRSGEWQGLAGLGISPGRRLAPLLMLGLLAGGFSLVLGEWVAPDAARSHQQRKASQEEGSLAGASETWIQRAAWVFRLQRQARGGLGPVEAFQVGESLGWRLQADALTWGDGWVASQQRAVHPAALWGGGHATPASPWHLLPAPQVLDGMTGIDDPACLRWRLLGEDGRARFLAERHARWSRALSCGAAALVGGMVPALYGAGAWVVALAALPVALWELVGILLQVAAGQGSVPPLLPALVRLLLALAILVVGYRRLR